MFPEYLPQTRGRSLFQRLGPPPICWRAPLGCQPPCGSPAYFALSRARATTGSPLAYCLPQTRGHSLTSPLIGFPSLHEVPSNGTHVPPPSEVPDHVLCRVVIRQRQVPLLPLIVRFRVLVCGEHRTDFRPYTIPWGTGMGVANPDATAHPLHGPNCCPSTTRRLCTGVQPRSLQGHTRDFHPSSDWLHHTRGGFRYCPRVAREAPHPSTP